MTCSGIYYDLMATSCYTKVKNKNKRWNKKQALWKICISWPHIETDHQNGN